MARDTDGIIQTKYANAGDVGLGGLDINELWPVSYSTPGGPFPQRIQFNQLFRYLSAICVELNQIGPFLEYSNLIDYGVGATVKGTNGIKYQCLIANGPSSSVVDPVGDVTGTWQFLAIRLSDYGGDLSAALSDIGSNDATLVIDTPFSTSSNVSSPINVSLLWFEGFTASLSTNKLTILGSLIAGRYRLFSDNADVDGLAKIDVAFPEWFGVAMDDSTDNSTNFDAFLEFIRSTVSGLTGVVGSLASGVMRTSGAHDLQFCMLRGSGIENTVIKGTGTGQRIITIPFCGNVMAGYGMHDLTIEEGGTNNIGLTLLGATFSNSSNFKIKGFVGANSRGISFYNPYNTTIKYTESNTLRNFVVDGCKYGIVFENDGTTADAYNFAYNKLINFSIANMLSGETCYGLWITDNTSQPQLYGCDIRGNIYTKDEATCVAMQIDGRVSESSIYLTGEAPSGSSNLFHVVKCSSTAIVKNNVGSILFRDGLFEFYAASVFKDNNIVFYSDGVAYKSIRDFMGCIYYLNLNTAISAAGGDVTIVYDTEVSGTEQPDSPANWYNSTTGEFKPTISGVYLVRASVRYTPAGAGEDKTLKIKKNDGATTGTVCLLDEKTSQAAGDLLLKGSSGVYLDGIDDYIFITTSTSVDDNILGGIEETSLTISYQGSL